MAVARKKTKKKIVQQSELYYSRKDMELLERIIRVEEEIKSINKNIEMFMKQINERIDRMEIRFENRFNKMFVFMGLGITLLTVLMSIYKFIQ